MHYLYADFREFEKFSKPESKIMEISIAGVQTIVFKRLDSAIKYRKENEGNFTFFEGDHPSVLNYWAYIESSDKEIERQAAMYRKQRDSECGW